MKILRAYLAGPAYLPNTDRRLFSMPTRGGGAKALKHNSLQVRLRDASRAAEIEPPIQFAGVLRNHLAAYLVDGGADTITASHLMGHT